LFNRNTQKSEKILKILSLQKFIYFVEYYIFQ